MVDSAILSIKKKACDMSTKHLIAGATSVLLYASKYHDVCMVVNASGRYDLKRGITEMFGQDCMKRLKDEGYVDVKYKEGDLLFSVSQNGVL